MSSTSQDNLANLAKAGKLKTEPPSQPEQAGLLAAAVERLADAERKELSYASRFDLAYNAAHGLALYAMRRMGYRSDNRYLVFQCLEHTAGLPAAGWRVLAKAHDRRNLAEYEGHLVRDEALLAEVIAAAKSLSAAMAALTAKEPKA